ncbi:MAG: SpoIIE family protein phosphatase [Verrucomicrobia bacterium]|nr:SpoIIE family protein phosphatase [Verrucomicrobiota bacterium]
MSGAFLVQAGLLGAIEGMAALWATLFFAACGLVALLRLKLNAEQTRARELEVLVDFAARRRRLAMELFQVLGSAFETRVSLDNLLRSTAVFFMRIAQATGAIVYVLDRERERLKPAALCGTLGGSIGSGAARLQQESPGIPLGEGILGEAALYGRPVFINDCSTDTRLEFLGTSTLRIENAMVVPLRFRDRSLGVLVVVNHMGEDGTVGKPFGRVEFQLLEALAMYAAGALYLALTYLEQAEKQRLDFDLGVASEIQRMLQPQHSPVLRNLSVVGQSRPAYRVGGDHYDFIELGGSRLGVLIADVSGKGVTGALVMAICHAIVRTHAARHLQPADAVKEFRRLLIEDIPEDRFITLTYGILDTETREFRFARAGHDPLLCYRAASGAVEVLSPKGGAIGLDRTDRFDRSLEQQSITLAPGDTIVLFTDGLTEAENPEGDEFSLNRLKALIAERGSYTAADLGRVIYEGVEAFAKGAPPLDDQTLVVIKAR